MEDKNAPSEHRQLTIREGQQAVDHWIRTYGIRYFSELSNLACLTEGELAKVMVRKYGDQSFKPTDEDNLEEEMGDVLWVLMCLANQTGIDLNEALQNSLDKKTKRDIERNKNNEKLKQ
jgi:NTP pyrophosphatase (non-canonical NTP hydrolase)